MQKAVKRWVKVFMFIFEIELEFHKLHKAGAIEKQYRKWGEAPTYEIGEN